jgi:hypothetical protein
MRSVYCILESLLIARASYMLASIIMGRWTRRMGQRIAQEKIMLIVELNIAGYQFSREIPNLRRTSLRPLRCHPRAMHWRVPQRRQSQAA